MTAIILNGQRTAKDLTVGLAQRIIETVKFKQRAPGLAVILVGNDPASEIYVRNKRRACDAVGITSYAYDLPTKVQKSSLLKLINELNLDKKVDGILVQLPLPKTIDRYQIISQISPTKDVDGFHPFNLGCLAQQRPMLRPCTPYGIIQLLTAYRLSLKGLHAVVVGASNIVGRPMALELLIAGCTVTVCHRATQHLEQHVRRADIVIVAVGQQHVVDSSWLHHRQIVIDVGIHRLADGSLAGDLDAHIAKQNAGWLTPVPGGVGPMTIITLMQNTLTAMNLSD